MTTLTEGRYAAEFLMSEGPANISRDRDTVKAGRSAVLAAGTVMQRGQDTLLVEFDGNTDSGGALDPEAECILLNEVDATGASNVSCAVISRMAEVNGQLLPNITNAQMLADATRSLKLKNIIVR